MVAFIEIKYKSVRTFNILFHIGQRKKNFYTQVTFAWAKCWDNPILFICTGFGRKHILHLLFKAFILVYFKLHNSFRGQAGNNISSQLASSHKHMRLFGRLSCLATAKHFPALMWQQLMLTEPYTTLCHPKLSGGWFCHMHYSLGTTTNLFGNVFGDKVLPLNTSNKVFSETAPFAIGLGGTPDR